MTHTLPKRGKGPEDAREALNNAERTHRNTSSNKGSRSRSQQARDDAQQSLKSLLSPTTSDTEPQVITPSGATRYTVRGRVAGPLPATPGGKAPKPGAGQLIEGKTGDSSGDPFLAIVPGTQPLYDESDFRAVPQGRLQTGLAVATERVQAARERAALLIAPLDETGLGSLAPVDAQAVHASRRAASKWVTRYATHLVILIVVGALVALGGLKTLTVQGAYNHDLQAVDAFTGTDHFDEEAAYGDGKTPVDSHDFTLALPRTELGGADAAANSRIVQPEAAPGSGPDAGVEPSTNQMPARTGVVKYTVAQGDTIESVAQKFNVMPETVMGSNGIFDGEESLAVGRVLAVPPVDGMYYVAQPGDTLDSVARRFQADPAAVAAYAPNNLANGAVQPGQEIVVPGGMMPQRETVLSYTVSAGDTLKKIAARYQVDVPTLLEANDIPDPDNLVIGSQLRILPIAGMEYKVKKGDTIITIADKLGVTPQMILDYSPNHLTTGSVLQIDQVIMVPGGSVQEEVTVAAARVEPVARGEAKPASNEKPVAPKPTAKAASAKPAPQPTAKPKTTTSSASTNTYKAGTGSMVWPVSGRITTYFSSSHNGLDIAISAGTPIHAADAGKVIWSGWRTDGLGYCVIIDHLNGLVTVYGHMIRQPKVYVGQYVDRGQIIGNIGSTGRSTGPHVHFMVKVGTGHNYRNPLSYLGR